MLKRSAVLLFVLFTMAAAEAATAAPVVIVTPAGGEFYVVGSKQRVRLDPKTKARSIAILLSIDGGETFPATLGTIDNTTKDKTKRNVLEFTVPNTLSGTCVIRASADGTNSVSAGFSIGSASAVNASQVDSGNSANGNVLTADGSGGSSFTTLDGKFVKVPGDTMTGTLEINNPGGDDFILTGAAAQYRFDADSTGLRVRESILGSSAQIFSCNAATGDISLGGNGRINCNGDNSVRVDGALTLEGNVFTNNFTANNSTCCFFCNTANNSITITLPNPATTPLGRFYIIKKIAAANSLTISSPTGTIEGASSVTMTAINDFRYIICAGSIGGWQIISRP